MMHNLPIEIIPDTELADESDDVEMAQDEASCWWGFYANRLSPVNAARSLLDDIGILSTEPVELFRT